MANRPVEERAVAGSVAHRADVSAHVTRPTIAPATSGCSRHNSRGSGDQRVAASQASPTRHPATFNLPFTELGTAGKTRQNSENDQTNQEVEVYPMPSRRAVHGVWSRHRVDPWVENRS